jgi:hypothetical protein
MTLNRVTVEELVQLPGVSAAHAQRLVDLRAARGRLGSVEELRIFPEMSDQVLEVLRNHLDVDAQVAGTSGKRYERAEDVLAAFAHEPTVQDVQNWTNSYAQTSPETVKRWLAASRSFAALPQLTLEYRLRDGWDQDFVYLNNTGLSPTSAEEAADAVFVDGGQDQDVYYTVRGRWDLNELVMSSERIRLINEAQDSAKLRDKLLSEATQLYFERRRLQVEMLLAPRADVLGQVKDQLRLMELTANLDALTGGAFSAALARTGG